jgi:PBP1b-binding outer membrane lipoprotein LpoB
VQKYLICGIVANKNKGYMIRFKTYSIAVFTVVLISSCSTTTVEEDVQQYCKCMENVKSNSDIKACIPLAEKMKDKYGSSPEEAEYIIENIKKCGRIEE